MWSKTNLMKLQANLCLCSELRIEKYLLQKFMRKSHGDFELLTSEEN